MWTAPDIEHARLLSIAATWRLIGSRRIVTSDTYATLGGFRIREPAADVDRQRRIVADRLASGVCAGCGDPRLATTRLCESCRLRALERVRRRQRRLDAAGLCRQCGQEPATRGGRCTGCRELRRQ